MFKLIRDFVNSLISLSISLSNPTIKDNLFVKFMGKV
jgi:hypothetical protein